jgi:tRNA threonylcarbamoyladenosine biosynthesis protein TsaE
VPSGRFPSEPTFRARLSEPDLIAWGRSIGAEAEPPLFIALRGPLGAGKSVLARAIARGAGVQDAVPSPTFNLLLRYPASRGRELVHLDLYRLTTASEVTELGWEALGGEREVVLVEWPERAEEMLPLDRWDVTLERVPGRPRLRDLEAARVGSPGSIPAPPAVPDHASAGEPPPARRR